MRDFYFFTNSKLTAEDCYEQLKAAIPHVVMNGSTDIRIAAKSRSYLWFYNDTIDGFYFDTSEEREEFRTRIPIKDPYITYFETHRSIDAKRVLKVLLQLRPEIYVNVEDYTDWTGSAQEYIDTEFDY